MMYSEDFKDKYIDNQLEIMERIYLKKSNIYRYALFKYKKCCVFSITKKMYAEAKFELRKKRLKIIIKNYYNQNF